MKKSENTPRLFNGGVVAFLHRLFSEIALNQERTTGA